MKKFGKILVKKEEVFSNTMNEEQEKAIRAATIRRTRKLKNTENQDEFSVHTEMNWEKMPQGGLVPNAGNSKEYKTGNWVPKKLLFDKEKCINCSLCWPVCPDDAIVFDEDGNMIGVDRDHCKDCGLCVKACPTESLYFEKETLREI